MTAKRLEANLKHQLFTCLTLMGVDADSRDLYQCRGA